MTTPLLTIREAATELGISVERVRQFIYEGRLAAERLGHIWVLTPAEVARFGQLARPMGRPSGDD